MGFQIWVRRIFIGHYLVQHWVLIFGWILCYDLRESKVGNLHDNLGTRILSLVLERALKKYQIHVQEEEREEEEEEEEEDEGGGGGGGAGGGG